MSLYVYFYSQFLVAKYRIGHPSLPYMLKYPHGILNKEHLKLLTVINNWFEVNLFNYSIITLQNGGLIMFFPTSSWCIQYSQSGAYNYGHVEFKI